MKTAYPLSIERLYGPLIVKVAAKHNLRELAAEIGVDSHIDPTRIPDNFILRGPNTAGGVARLAKSLMEAAGVTKFRKNSVMALELLFTLPTNSAIDQHQYFENAVCWAEGHFGVPVLSAIAHCDESAPHCHVLLLPLVNGRMGGSDLHGGKAKLWAMQTSFHAQVGARYGLVRQAPQKRHSAAVRNAAMALARESLLNNSALTDEVIMTLIQPHTKSPEALLQALGLTMPVPKAKAKGSFVGIMIGVVKSESCNPIGKVIRNAIGKADVVGPADMQPYTCVGIGFSTYPNSSDSKQQQAATETHTTNADTNSKARQIIVVDENRPPMTSAKPEQSGAETEGDYAREHDADAAADTWDSERGEFIKPTAKPSNKRRQVIEAVNMALSDQLKSTGKGRENVSCRN